MEYAKTGYTTINILAHFLEDYIKANTIDHKYLGDPRCLEIYKHYRDILNDVKPNNDISSDLG